jgi:hypothetical protein
MKSRLIASLAAALLIAGCASVKMEEATVLRAQAEQLQQQAEILPEDDPQRQALEEMATERFVKAINLEAEAAGDQAKQTIIGDSITAAAPWLPPPFGQLAAAVGAIAIGRGASGTRARA